MLTADTVTDAQIRELRESLVAEAERARDAGVRVDLRGLLEDCNDALNADGEELKPEHQRAARSRCAKILNAQNGRVPPRVVHKIDNNLPTEVLAALAKACGFRITFDSPEAHEWTLSHEHVPTLVQHVGTRQDVCAFLTGYADMQLLTTQILNELDSANRNLILDMRARLRR